MLNFDFSHQLSLSAKLISYLQPESDDFLLPTLMLPRLMSISKPALTHQVFSLTVIRNSRTCRNLITVWLQHSSGFHLIWNTQTPSKALLTHYTALCDLSAVSLDFASYSSSCSLYPSFSGVLSFSASIEHAPDSWVFSSAISFAWNFHTPPPLILYIFSSWLTFLVKPSLITLLQLAYTLPFLPHGTHCLL